MAPFHLFKQDEKQPDGPPPYVEKPPPSSSSTASSSRPPPAGLRTPCSTSTPFPDLSSLGPPPFRDFGGEPVWVCSAINGDSVHPCKAAPHLSPPVRLPWGGRERDHHGRYDILPITADMEWVPASHGRVPPNRRPVEGGYEAHGEHLWHAATTLSPEYGGVTLPGKTGTHLGGANFAFGGTEIIVRDGYQILCWR